MLFSISREKLIQSFDMLFAELIRFKRLEGKDVNKHHEEELAKVLESFGFTDPSISTLDYTPSFNGYDVIIDTSKIDSKGAVSILKKYEGS